ncbi:MAG: CotH kinase family protein [Kiritimatiellae bacterium]|jgi:hypothetical protein|nr:CotH kinase family protein [Kiritimatiellia bacterium]
MKKTFSLLLAFLCINFTTAAIAALVINEVCYDNSKTADETGDTTSDWIELYNSGPIDVNILNYGVGDQNGYIEAKGVRLPDYSIPAGGYLLIFANSDLAEYTAWTNAEDLVVIPENSSWKAYHNSSVPAGSWSSGSYIDSTWQEGISPMGHNTTAGSMDCATILGDPDIPSTLYQTAYFRKKFDVIKPSAVTGMVMNARIKDGMVVYLNDTEIYRYNMPAGLISYSTQANSSIPSTLWISTLLDASHLIQGENTLAIEVHKAFSTGTALIMDMSLTALVDEQKPIVHGQFGLKKEGEKAHLFNSNLIRIDGCEAPTYEIGENNSWGTTSDGAITSFTVYNKTTPAYSNTTWNKKYKETLSTQIPVFTAPPGIYATAQSVRLSTPSARYKIYYTLDGTDPWKSTTFVWSGNSISIAAPANTVSGLAWKRTNPVEVSANVPDAIWLQPNGSIDKAVVLRAIAVNIANTECSPEMSGTYFIGAEYSSRSLPIFSLITDEDNLFGFVKGLCIPGKNYADSLEGYGDNKWGKPYANYHQDSVDESWERPIHMELFETNQATSAISMDMGVAMHGGGSRTIPQKTLYMIARNGEYGTDYIDYQLFPDLPATLYKRFLLRNSGNDWYGATSSGSATMLKDAVFHEICKSLDISVMAYRPSLVYINGEYWGIHNLRESYDKHYVYSRYNIDPDNADMLTQVEDGNNVAIVRIDGDKSSDEDYEALLEWIDNNPLSNPDNINYQSVTSQVDISNYADYIIAETFFANTDWPQNNCDFWRAHTNQTATAGEYGDQRWRWMLYDMDVAGEEGSDFDMFDYLSDKSMTNIDEAGFLINELWKNMTFRNLFISRYADTLNTCFRPAHTTATIADAAQEIASEISTHFVRWGRTTTSTQWQNAFYSSLISYSAERYTASWLHLNSNFNLGGTGLLTLKNQNSSGTGGHLAVNGIDLTIQTPGVSNPADWTGKYFQILPVNVEAVPESGYLFDGWVGTTITNVNRTVYVTSTPRTMVARFRLAGDPPYSTKGYEAWQIANYTEQNIVSDTNTAPDSPSGQADMSNFELYAFGMHISDGLSDAQRIARASLSINSENSALWVGYNRLNDAYQDISYTLKTTDSLTLPLVWYTAIAGNDILDETLTNTVDSTTRYYQHRLNNEAQGKDTRFFKLEIEPQ